MLQYIYGRFTTNPWIIWYAIFLHLILGVCAVLFEPVGNISAMDGPKKLFTSSHVVGVSMCIAAVLAIIALLGFPSGLKDWKTWSISIMLLVPQQVLLILSAAGAVEIIYNSQFADGVIRPRSFIFADQFHIILITVIHTLALIDLHRQPAINEIDFIKNEAGG